MATDNANDSSHGEAAELGARLAMLSDEELLRRCASGFFSEEAHAIATAELRGRGIQAPELPQPEPPQEPVDPEVYHGDMVTIARRFTPTDAQMLCGCLEAAGIPATVADAALVQANMLWSIALGGASLRVPQAFVEQANEVIAAFERGEFSLDEDFDPNTP